MSTSNAAQFGLLLWKNWLLRKRRIILTVLQILLPTVLPLLLLGFRFLVKSQSKFISSPTIFDSFEVSTLPPNLTLPAERGGPGRADSPPWSLVYSPITSRAATRMALGVTKMLNMIPIGILMFTFHYFHPPAVPYRYSVASVCLLYIIKHCIALMARVVSSSSCSSASTRVQKKTASVRERERNLAHRYRVLKPNVQRHANITPVSFGAPSEALNPTLVCNSVIFNIYISVSPKQCKIGP